MLWSVELESPEGEIEAWDVVVGKPKSSRRIVRLEKRGRKSKAFAEVWDGWDGYTAVAFADTEELIGPRMVDGFRSVRSAIEYVVKITTYVNQRYKRRQQND